MERDKIIWAQAQTQEAKRMINLVTSSYRDAMIINGMCDSADLVKDEMKSLKDAVVFTCADKWNLAETVDLLERMVTVDDKVLLITVSNARHIELYKEAMPYCDFLTGYEELKGVMFSATYERHEHRDEKRDIDLLIGDLYE